MLEGLSLPECYQPHLQKNLELHNKVESNAIVNNFYDLDILDSNIENFQRHEKNSENRQFLLVASVSNKSQHFTLSGCSALWLIL